MRSMRSPAELTSAFRAQGLKVTPQRQLLFRLLHGNQAHPSAEALFHVASEQMPGISLRTVYQTLTDLATMGELRQLSLGAGSSRFDPNVDDHHHLVCHECGDVRDVYVHDVASLTDGVRAADVDGFEVDTTFIVFGGRCAACAARSSSTETSS